MNNHTNRATRLAIKMIEFEDEEQDMHKLIFEFQVYILALYGRQVCAFTQSKPPLVEFAVVDVLHPLPYI